jgi:hypothetical protein
MTMPTIGPGPSEVESPFEAALLWLGTGVDDGRLLVGLLVWTLVLEGVVLTLHLV